MKTIEWDRGIVKLIDQTKLPLEKVIVKCKNYEEVAKAIKDMQIRGAPAIGVAASMGMALGAWEIESQKFEDFFKELENVGNVLKGTRPTAVNLFWAVDRMMKVAQRNKSRSVEEIKGLLVQEALKVDGEDTELNMRMGEFGAELIKDGNSILTHCNAGGLATAEYGTAIGVIKTAHRQGKRVHVFVDETRPFLQGARLTAWELIEEGVEMTLITDNMSGYFMQKGQIDAVIVGADRIAANGDVANKIGTYSVAVLAKEHKIPFYVAAPVSTLDLTLETGDEIPIEERDEEEVTCIKGIRIAPYGVTVRNPAFDVTPNNFVSAIITEKGVKRQPYIESLRDLE